MTGEGSILSQWREHLETARRRSPHTVRAYVATAQRLTERLALDDWQGVAALSTRDLRGQLAARRADGLGNASAARELSALKAFVTYAREQVGADPGTAPRLRGPRIKKGIPRPVTPDEATNLVEAVAESGGEDWIGLRDAAVMLLMYGAGMRIAEALSLKASDLPLGETLVVTGKVAGVKVTSADSAEKPAASSASFTSRKSAGSVVTCTISARTTGHGAKFRPGLPVRYSWPNNSSTERSSGRTV